MTDPFAGFTQEEDPFAGFTSDSETPAQAAPTPLPQTSHDLGVGSVRTPRETSMWERMKIAGMADEPSDSLIQSYRVLSGKDTVPPLIEALEKRRKVLQGYSPITPGGLATGAYRAVTGEAPSGIIPEPTAEGVLKGISNVGIGAMRLDVEAKKKLAQLLGIKPLEQAYDEKAAEAAWLAQKADQLYKNKAQQSLSGEMIGEAVPGMLVPGGAAPGMISKLPLAGRMAAGGLEGAATAMAANPQAEAQTSKDYWDAQMKAATMGGVAGTAAPAATALANPIMRLFKGGKPQLNAANLPAELEARMGGRVPGEVAQEDLAAAYEKANQEASAPFEALRAQDAPVRPAPNVELYGGKSTFNGKRYSPLMGPEDEFIVAKTPDGKEAGFIWLTKEDGGFSIRKIEVKPEYQHQGIGTYLNDEAEKAFGPYKGATDYTPEGKAFRESIKARDAKSIELPSYRKSLDDVADELFTGGGEADDATIKTLKGFAAGYDRSKRTGWGRALEISKQINDRISEAHKAGNKYKAEQLGKVKKALEADLAEFPAYKEAKAMWKEGMGPWEAEKEGGTFLKKAMESPTPEGTLAAISNARTDKALIFYDRMTPKGRDAVKAFMLDDLVQKAGDDPLAIAKALKKRGGAWGVFFQGEDAKKLDGFERIARYAHRAGWTISMVGGAAASSAMGLAHPLIGGYMGGKFTAGPAAKGFRKMFSSDAMQRMLLDAQKLGDDDPKLAEILGKLPMFAGTQAGKSDKLKKLLGE